MGWGYDQAHTDQRHPYTPEQLAARQECPHRYAYPTPEAYMEGWRLWRAYRRDDRLNAGEAAALREVIRESAVRALPPDLAEAVVGVFQEPEPRP